MGNTARLFAVLLVGSLIATVLYFGFALALAALLEGPGVPRAVQGVGVAATVLVPICLAASWVFRRLRGRLIRREALVATLAFGIFVPVPLGATLLLGPIVGGYTGILLRRPSPWVAFSGAAAGIAAAIALVTFATSSLALFIARHTGGAHRAQ